MKEIFPSLAKCLLGGASVAKGVSKLNSSVVDMTPFRAVTKSRDTLGMTMLERQMTYNEKTQLMLLQAKFGLHCDLTYSDLESKMPQEISILDIKSISNIIGILEIMRVRRYDVGSVAGVVVKEIESPRRLGEFASQCNPTDAIRLIRILRFLEYRSVELASVCSDKLCSSLDQRTPQELIDVLEWMKAFGYSHTQLIDNLIDAILVIPLSDEELYKIVRNLIHIKRDIGPKEEFLQRLVKFRLATVE